MTEIAKALDSCQGGAQAPRGAPDPSRTGVYDLRALFRVAGVRDVRPTAPGHRRVVRSVDPCPRDIRALPPLSVVGFADGVQASKLVRHHERRPVTLAWVAAGVVTSGGVLAKFSQRIALVGSAADAVPLQRWARIAGGLPVHLLEELTPWGVATATQLLVDTWRRELEAHVVASVTIPEDQFVVVDGSIRAHTRDGLVSVVKSTEQTQYLSDESSIPDDAGWRSAVFELPATTTAERDVLSTYCRLHDAPPTQSWSHGIVRIEARDESALDAACALAMRHAQSPGSGDPRWPVHLSGMRRAEDVLTAFRPPVFSM
jgi:hypothetical protein